MHAKIATIILLAASVLAAPYDISEGPEADGLIERDDSILERSDINTGADFDFEERDVFDDVEEHDLFELEERAACPPAVNAASLKLTENSEGWRPKAYKDPTGHWTVGYGHLCAKAGCAGVGYPLPLSTANGAKLLQADLKIAETCLKKALNSKVKLNPNQYGALVDWAFNVGCGNVDSSTLIADLNKGQNPDAVAKAQLPRWVYSGKTKLPGLVTRRKNEVKLFTTAAKGQSLPC